MRASCRHLTVLLLKPSTSIAREQEVSFTQEHNQGCLQEKSAQALEEGSEETLTLKRSVLTVLPLLDKVQPRKQSLLQISPWFCFPEQTLSEQTESEYLSTLELPDVFQILGRKLLLLGKFIKLTDQSLSWDQLHLHEDFSKGVNFFSLSFLLVWRESSFCLPPRPAEDVTGFCNA